jgi:hypothetical protein
MSTQCSTNVVDLDADPVVPKGWKLEEHVRGGQFEWDPDRIDLYLSPKQRDGGAIDGDALLAELRGRPVFNANLLDFLMAHLELIPESWRGSVVCFWGTTFRHINQKLGVRCLHSVEGRWVEGYRWIDGEGDWRDIHAAAELAASTDQTAQ